MFNRTIEERRRPHREYRQRQDRGLMPGPYGPGPSDRDSAYRTAPADEFHRAYGRSGGYPNRAGSLEQDVRSDWRDQEPRTSSRHQQERRGGAMPSVGRQPDYWSVGRGYGFGSQESSASRKRTAEGTEEMQTSRFKSPRRDSMQSSRKDWVFDENDSKPVGFSDAASAKGFERIRKRVVGSLTVPFYGGPSPGPLTESNCAVFLEEKMRSTLRTMESGVARLEKDELIDGVWTTVCDVYTARRIELLSEFLQSHLGTRDAMDSDEPLEVWSITGDVQVKRKDEMTCTDYLRLLVREQALTSGSRELAETALGSVVRQTNEAWAAAAARVVKLFRASFASADNPCMSETQFFWRFVTEANMRELFSTTTDVLVPNPLERTGVDGLLLEHTQRIATSLRPLRLESYDPMGVAMVNRGVMAHQLFKQFVGVLSARSVSCKQASQTRGSKRVGSGSVFSLQELSEMFSSKQAFAAALVDSNKPARAAPTSNGGAVAAMSFVDHANPTLSEPALEPTRPHVAAFQNQPATVPGQHGVPFETSKPTGPATPQPPVYPPADAPRSEILDFLRSHNLCYRSVFSGRCARPRCPFNHELVPAGFYTAISRERRGAAAQAPPRQMVAAMTEASYEYCVEMGLVSDHTGTFEEDTGDAAS